MTVQINWKKGFNRLFVVLSVAWGVFALWYLPVRQWHEQFDMAYEEWNSCLESAESHSYRSEIDHKAAVEACNQERDKTRKEIPPSAWADLGMNGWFFLILTALVPPAMVYVVVLVGLVIVRWVWRGFKRSG